MKEKRLGKNTNWVAEVKTLPQLCGSASPLGEYKKQRDGAVDHSQESAKGHKTTFHSNDKTKKKKPIPATEKSDLMDSHFHRTG